MMGVVLALAAAAAQPAILPEAEQRRLAGEALGRLLADDDAVHYSRDEDGSDTIMVHSRWRASAQPGLCERDRLWIDRDPGAAGAAPAVRTMTSERHFLLLSDDDGRPQPDVAGDALARRCAGISTAREDWFDADGAEQAKAAVTGLAALPAALREPGTPRIEWACTAPHCPDAAELAELADDPSPLITRPVWEARHCPPGLYCVVVKVGSGVLCGGWRTQLRLTGADAVLRFHSARVGGFDAAICD